MKTKKQKRAWRQILIMTSDPEWYKNPANVKLHKELMQELNMSLEDGRKTNKGITLDVQKYLDGRPGLEASILGMMKEKKTVNEMRKIHPVCRSVYSFIRKKYGLSMKKHDPPVKELLEKSMREDGITGIANKFGVSKTTVYSWLDSYEIERPRINKAKLGKDGNNERTRKSYS